MAMYKVPQDVEAEDKLIGPFTFRQFIYLLIVAAAIGIAWVLSRIFIGLAVIPLPVILLFGTLALPLRKDQPMEIYLAALISFALKPHQRKWDPDGIESLIEVTAPKTPEEILTKNISQDEAEQRFGYLAQIVDSQGWAVRGVQAPNSSMNSDVYYSAQQTEDVLDNTNEVSLTLDQKLAASDEKRRQDLVNLMRSPVPAPAPAVPVAQPTPASTYSIPTTPVAAPVNQPIVPGEDVFSTTQAQALPNLSAPVYNPYPSFQQTVINPINDPSHVAHPAAPAQPQAASNTASPAPQTPSTTTSEKPLSADIINLATNSDLSIETIAREANRIQHKEESGSDEVYVSLR